MCMHGEYDSTRVLTVSENAVRDEWMLDYGCSNHMIHHGRYFQHFEKLEGGKALENNQHCVVKDIGYVKLKLDDLEKFMSGVGVVPDFKEKFGKETILWHNILAHVSQRKRILHPIAQTLDLL